MKTAEQMAREILGKIGIQINGPNPWDPQVHNPAIYSRVFSQGSIGLGEGYMEGWWDCERLDLFFSRVTGGQLRKHVRSLNTLWLAAKSTVQNRQTKKRSLKVGEIHYDLPIEVWKATLDESMTGSCAYYRAGKETLEQAQEEKKKLVFEKLDLQRGHSLLDIGVGWASFAGYALEKYGARPIGVTVSSVQRDFIKNRYGGAIDVRVHDYRDTVLREPVDRIISVEMFEQVGADNFRTFFELARKWLKPDGRMVLHTIVRHNPMRHIDAWMEKYIYPGGCLPTPGQIGTAVHGLFHIEDVHDIGAHYPRTLVAWIDKFRSNRDGIKALGREKLGMDPEMFCRMWDYHYLASAGGFDSRTISVHQYVLSPNGIPGGMEYIR